MAKSRKKLNCHDCGAEAIDECETIKAPKDWYRRLERLVKDDKG